MKRPGRFSGVLLALTIVLLPVIPADGAVFAEKAAVSSPERLATSAGLNILRQGGTAADAAVAIAFALTVLRPDSASVLGGGTALYFDASEGEVWALDFRPELPNVRYVEDAKMDGNVPLAVPGLPAGLRDLHEKFGSSAWESLLQPAIALAREGTISERADAAGEAERLSREIDSPSPVTDPVILERLADRGASDVYRGATSELLVKRSRELGGAITPRALDEYRPRWRSPLRLDFRGERVYTIPAPAGAGGVLAEALILLSGFEWNGRVAGDPGTSHLFVEAERYGWGQATKTQTERGVSARQVPVTSEDPGQIRSRIEQGPLEAPGRSVDGGIASLGYVVVDDQGNAAVVTLSVGPPFGSGRVAGSGAYIAVTPDDGVIQTSLPILVVRDDSAAVLLAASGRGREASIGASLYLRSRMLGAELEDLIEMPRFIPSYEAKTIMIEKGTDLVMVEELNRLGHGAEWHDRLGVLHAIEIDGRKAAISDPRGGTPGGY